MDETSRRIGSWGSFLAVSLALAIGCSSQETPGSGSGGSTGSGSGGSTGSEKMCGPVGPVPIQTGAAACTITVDLSRAADPNNIKLQDQSMVTIPYSTSNGWMYGDPAAPILLTGSYCMDAMAGTLTAVTVLFGCATGIVVGPSDGVADGGANCSITTYVFPSRSAIGDAAADPCDFPLTARPPDPYNIRVRTGTPSATSTTIPPSASDGWSYAPDLQSIVLVGAYCQAATDGAFSAITVDFGCSGVGIP